MHSPVQFQHLIHYELLEDPASPSWVSGEEVIKRAVHAHIRKWHLWKTLKNCEQFRKYSMCPNKFCLQQTIKAMRPGNIQFLFWLVQNRNELCAQNITSWVDIISRLHLNSALHKHAAVSAKEAIECVFRTLLGWWRSSWWGRGQMPFWSSKTSS